MDIGTPKQANVEQFTDASSAPRAAAKYAVEAIGTYFLVFTVGTAVGSRSSLAPLAISHHRRGERTSTEPLTAWRSGSPW
jgi:aquaporin Z